MLTRIPATPRLLCVGLACALFACDRAGERAPHTAWPTDLGAATEISSPAAPRSLTPYLAVTSDDRLLLSWTQRGQDSSISILMAEWKDEAWDSTRTIVADRKFFVNWADFPAITALGNGDIAAHWLEYEGSGTYAYGIRVVRSTDRGRSWSTPITPHTDGLEAEHGFVSLWADGADGIGLVWLDGRKSAVRDSAQEMTLRTAVITAHGALEREALIDARTCDCCQTGTALARSGRVIVYRDRDPLEIRDIAVVRSTGKGWTEPQKIHDDQWHYPGCPVNGPQVAASGDTVAVAWYTAAGNSPRVYVARSEDGGITFTAPVRVDQGDPIGRVEILLDDLARPIVIWLERRAAGQADIMARRVGPDGQPGVPEVVARTSDARASGFPRAARHGDAIFIAYTAVSSVTSPTIPSVTTVRLARVPLLSTENP